MKNKIGRMREGGRRGIRTPGTQMRTAV